MTNEKRRKCSKCFQSDRKSVLPQPPRSESGEIKVLFMAVVVRVTKRYVYACTTDQNGEAKPWDEYTFDKTDLKQQQYSPQTMTCIHLMRMPLGNTRAKLSQRLYALLPSMSIRQMELEPLKAIYEIPEG